MLSINPVSVQASSSFSVGAGAVIATTSLAGLAAAARTSVASVRAAFVAGSAPVLVAGSGSVSDYVSRFGSITGSSALISSTARLGLSTSPPGATKRPPRPEIDHVEVSFSPSIGLVDSFFTTITVSLSVIEAGAASSIMVYRARSGPVPGHVRPSVSALSGMVPSGNTRKNLDPIAVAAFRSADLGGGNMISGLISDDQTLGYRVSQPTGSTLSAPLQTTNISRAAGSGELLSIANVDPAILNDTSFFMNRRALVGSVVPTIPLTTGGRSGLSVIPGSALSAGTVTQGPNSAKYSIIATVSTRLTKTVGDFVEITIDDPSVIYGQRYSYYAVSVSGKSLSLRSRIVTVDITSVIPPTAPKLSVNVIHGSPRFTLQCARDFSDHVEVHRKGGEIPDSAIVLSVEGALVSEGTPIVSENGFYHLGDLGLGADKSVSFVDTSALPGEALDYRFYSVDSFGLKSQVASSSSLLLADAGGTIPLPIPSINAEQLPGSPAVKIDVSCVDPRVEGMVVSRRIRSQNESGFHRPNDPERCRIGNRDVKRARSSVQSPMMVQPLTWNGFVRAVSGTAQIIDKSVEYDRIYQYSVSAVSFRGQRSAPSFSTAFRVTTNPIVDPPHDVRVSLIPLDEIPTGVKVEWSGSTLDFNPAQLIGSQDDLLDTAVRTVYQVERRLLAGQWQVMPSVTSSWFIDPVSDGQNPPFRPSFAKLLAEYEYRVIAMQSGGYLSVYSNPIAVTVEPPVFPPPALFVRSTNLAVLPLATVISWDYGSGPVDRWQIDRVAVNKVFGSKLVTVNSDAVRSLSFVPLAEVTRESSRARPVSTDGTAVLDKKIYVGNRFYVDHDVNPANTYFYRIRAVLPSDTPSEWKYGGISLNDSAHNRKFVSTLTDGQKVSLAGDPRPITSTGFR